MDRSDGPARTGGPARKLGATPSPTPREADGVRLTRREFLRSRLRPDLGSWRDLALASVGGFLAELAPEDESQAMVPLRLGYRGSAARCILAGEASVVLPPAAGQLAMLELPEASAPSADLLAALADGSLDVWCGPLAMGLDLLAGDAWNVRWVAGLTFQRVELVPASGRDGAGNSPRASALPTGIPAAMDHLDWVARLYAPTSPGPGAPAADGEADRRARFLYGPELALALASGQIHATLPAEVPAPGYLPYGLFAHRRVTQGARHRLLLLFIQALARRCRRLASSAEDNVEALARLVPAAQPRLAALDPQTRAGCLDGTAPAYVPAPLLAEAVAARLQAGEGTAREGDPGQLRPEELLQAVYTGDGA